MQDNWAETVKALWLGLGSWAGFGFAIGFAAICGGWLIWRPVARWPSRVVDPSKLFIGWSERGTPITYDGDAHLLTVAPTGAGKGTGAIIPNLLHYSGPVIVIDPKGENYLVTARYRQEVLGQEIYLLDPFYRIADAEMKYGRRAALNPLDILWNASLAESEIALARSFDADAQMLASLLNERESEKDPVWDRTAKALIAGMISLVAKHPDPAMRNLWTLSQLVADPDFDDRIRMLYRGFKFPWGDNPLYAGDNNEIIEEQVESYLTWWRSEHSEARDGDDAVPEPSREAVASRLYLKRRDELSDEERLWLPLFLERASAFGTLAKRELGSYFSIDAAVTRAGVIFTARSYTTFLSSGLEPSLAESTAGLNERVMEGKRNFSLYLVMPPEKLSSHATLLRLWISALITIILRRRRIPAMSTVFLLDECAQLGSLDPLRQVVTLLRGFGVKAWMFFQDLTQLQRLYARDWQTLINNCGVVNTFGIPRTAFAEDIAAVIGGVDPNALQAMTQNEQLISRAGRRPFRARLACYFKDALFAGRCDRNPYYGEDGRER